jgi:hypothetical protein
MRPGKKIYLYCQDEDRRAVLSYVLWCHQFRVTTDVSDDADAALIVYDERAYAHAIRLSSKCPELPILVLAERGARAKFDYIPTAATLDDKVPMVELRERIKTMAVGKRGPKRFHLVAREAMTA